MGLGFLGEWSEGLIDGLTNDETRLDERVTRCLYINH